jgi:hypothetical protein
VLSDNTSLGKKSTKKEVARSASSASSVLDSPQGKKAAGSKAVSEVVEPVLPDDIDAELDVVVESEGITLETLTSDLADDSDDLDDLDDDFVDDDFAEDLADEADEDLDLTEDLSEELGPGKFIREPEGNTGDDEDEIPRSW